MRTTDRNTYTYTNPDADSYTNGYAHGHADSDCHSNPYAHGNAEACTDAKAASDPGAAPALVISVRWEVRWKLAR